MLLGVLLWCLSSLEYVGSPNIRSRLLLRKIQKESLKILEALGGLYNGYQRVPFFRFVLCYLIFIFLLMAFLSTNWLV